MSRLPSALYFDKREEVELYLGVMDFLGATAPTPSWTKQLLAQVLDDV